MVAVLVMAAGLGITASARAGTYEVFACSKPDGSPAPSSGWAPLGEGSGIYLGNDCNAGSVRPGTMYGGGRATTSTYMGGFVFTAPPGVSVVSLSLDRAAIPDVWLAPATVWSVTQGLPDASRPYGLEICSGGAGLCTAGLGSFTNPADGSNRVSFTGFRAQQMFAFLSSGGGYSNTSPSSARFVIYRAVTGLSDESPPVVDTAIGTLTAGAAPLGGQKSVVVSATDSGGGISTIGLLVDDQVVIERPIDPVNALCRVPYTAVSPCPLATRTELALETGLLADGPHRARVFAMDVGGNRGVSSPFEFATRNGFVPNGVNATRFAKLAAWFSGGSRRRAAAAVRYRATRTIRGQLTTSDGAPIPSAVVDVTATHLRTGARARPAGQVTTDSEGGFAYRAPAGPARTFEFGYRAFSLDDGYSAAATTRLMVRPEIALSVRPRQVRNGDRVTFSGRLVGGPGRGDATVTLYALAGGARARIPVESLRTDARGRFRLRYRFRTVTGHARFRFSARIQRQAGYPYSSGASPSVSVTVNG